MHVHFITHASYEYPGYLLQWAGEKKFTTTFSKMYESTEFPEPGGIDLLIVMGGPMGVYENDKHPWIEKEKQFIQEVIVAGKKVMGICFGSQMVASALGAKVYPHNKKEIGWLPVQKAAGENESLLTKELPDEFVTFHWHGDTFSLPPGAVHLLQSAATLHQAYLYDNRVLGLQFHMEAVPDLVAAMVQHGREELVPADYVQEEETILAQKEHYAINNNLLKKLLTGFLQQ